MAKRRRSGSGDQRASPRPGRPAAPSGARGPLSRRGERRPPTEEPPPAGLADLVGSERNAWLTAAAVGIAAFVLYLLTLAPTVVGGDSGELITAAHVLGVPHPPGYPTFMLLAHLFGLLPLGSPATGMNLLSAILDGLAIGVIVVAVLVTAGPVVRSPATRAERALVLAGAAFGAGLLAVSSAFWSYSLVTEVFPLNNLLAGLVVVAMVGWYRRPGAATGRLWLAALLSGLALTNQQTIILFAPGLLILYLAGLGQALRADDGSLPPRRALLRLVAAPVVLLVVGLLPYLYLPIAAAGDPAVNWGDPRTLGRIWAVISRESYGTLSLTVRETRGGIVDQLVLLGGYVLWALTPVGLVLAAAGWWILSRASAVVGAAMATLVMVSGPLFVVFANPPLDDPVTRGVLERFYILPTIPLAILAGVGAIVAARWALAAIGSSAARPALAAIASLGVVLLATIVVVRWPAVDQRDNRVAETYGRDILAALEPGALLLMRSDENYTSVVFDQVVEGVRPDVVAIDVELLKLSTYVDQVRRRHPDVEIPFGSYDEGVTSSLADLVRANLPQRPVFVVGRLKEDLTGRFDQVPWGLSRRFLPAGSAPPADQAARDDAARFAALHPPSRAWPETTWEGAIGANYGSAAFEDGHARQVSGPQSDWAEIAELYRTALRLAPTLASADKNLGLLLLDNGGPTGEIIAVWRRYLELVPDDPDAAAIRSELERLAGSPAP